jgi:hypothetical protein
MYLGLARRCFWFDKDTIHDLEREGFPVGYYKVIQTF